MIANILKAIIKLLFGMFLLVDIPLLGWGFDDITGFLANPARVAFLAGSGVLGIVYAWFMPQNTLSDGIQGKLVNRQKLMLWLSILIYIVMFTSLPYCDHHNLWLIEAENNLRYTGVIIFLIGVLFSTWGPLHLGKQFSFNLTIQEEHKLVTDGPFRWVRHPRYFGLITWIVGVSLIHLSIVGLVLTGIMIILLAWRIYDEERLLYQVFGQQWITYCQQTKKIIPLIL